MGSVKTAIGRELEIFAQHLTSGPSPLFAEALERLNRARCARASIVDKVEGERGERELALDAIDSELFSFAWNLVGQQATSLDDFAIKAKFVQEYNHAEPGQIDSDIVLSLCRDLVDLAYTIALQRAKHSVDPKSTM